MKKKRAGKRRRGVEKTKKADMRRWQKISFPHLLKCLATASRLQLEQKKQERDEKDKGWGAEETMSSSEGVDYI